MKKTLISLLVASSAFAAMQVNAGTSKDTRGLSLQFYNKGSVEQSRKQPAIASEALESIDAPAMTDQQVMGGFTLQGLTFTGNTVYSAAELEALVARYIGTRVLASDLEDIRLALSQHYILNGYINSGALLPDQTVSNGLVQFQIVEGRISSVNISGSGRLVDGYISRQLVDDEPFNQNTLQENFQLLLEDPLIETAAASLRPGATKGSAVLDLQVERARAYGLDISYDNHRPVATGDTQTRVSGWLRNITGLGDYLQVAAIHREGSDGYDVSYELPIGLGGTSIGFATSEGDTDVIEASVKVLDIKSDYKASSVFINKELYRSVHGHMTLGAELSSREVTNNLLGLPWSFSPGENDGFAKVSAARLKLDVLSKSASDVLSFRATVSQGLDAMDSTQNADGRPDSDFTSAMLQLQYARMLNGNGLQVQFRGSYSWANEALLPVEQVAMGGANTVRGYRENELVRDKGLLLSTQLLYPLSDAASSMGRWNVLAFADYGTASNVDPGPNQSFDEMSSVGVGLQWRYKDILSADLYFAHALEEAPKKAEQNLQDDGIHFRISVAAF